VAASFSSRPRAPSDVDEVIRHDTARRVLLILSALVFAAIAAGALVAPRTMAAQFQMRLDHVDALNEYRAVYVGLWLAQAAMLSIAARQVRWALLGDLGALLILGQVAGRLASLILDGPPSAKVWPTLLMELVAGLAILLVRPRASLSGAPPPPR
jgi:hypothetical protein